MQNVRPKSFLSSDVFGQNCRELSLCLPLQFYKQFPDQIKKTWVFCHLVNECHIYLHNSKTFGELDWVVLCPKRLLFSITMLPCELQCQTATLQAVELLGKFPESLLSHLVSITRPSFHCQYSKWSFRLFD